MRASASGRTTGTSSPVPPSLTWPRPRYISLISIIHEGPLTPLPEESRGIKRFGANNSSCSESQWLCAVNPSQGLGEACHDITQILLKLRTSRNHKLGANGWRCHGTGRMYGRLRLGSNYTLKEEAWLSIEETILRKK